VQHLYNVRPLRSLGCAGQCSNTLDWFLPLAVVSVAHSLSPHTGMLGLEPTASTLVASRHRPRRDPGLLHPSVRDPLRCRKWVRLL